MRTFFVVSFRDVWVSGKQGSRFRLKFNFADFKKFSVKNLKQRLSKLYESPFALEFDYWTDYVEMLDHKLLSIKVFLKRGPFLETIMGECAMTLYDVATGPRHIELRTNNGKVTVGFTCRMAEVLRNCTLHISNLAAHHINRQPCVVEKYQFEVVNKNAVITPTQKGEDDTQTTGHSLYEHKKQKNGCIVSYSEDNIAIGLGDLTSEQMSHISVHIKCDDQEAVLPIIDYQHGSYFATVLKQRGHVQGLLKGFMVVKPTCHFMQLPTGRFTEHGVIDSVLWKTFPKPNSIGQALTTYNTSTPTVLTHDQRKAVMGFYFFKINEIYQRCKEQMRILIAVHTISAERTPEERREKREARTHSMLSLIKIHSTEMSDFRLRFVRTLRSFDLL